MLQPRKTDGFLFFEEQHICPYCSSSSNERIPRGWLVKVFVFWTKPRRFCCYGCHRKFYKSRSRK